MDAPITKRLIISGLTPSISADDISRRLTTFGTVKATDGFGLPDGVGQPRKFGYVTLETTVGNLSKCMNLLSGSTWKGAKLRFGEAKPDFREKIALENQQAEEEPSKKKRKRHAGVYAEDMTLVSPENAAQRPGWKVSSLGRTTIPVKMRPAHPLIEAHEEKKPKKSLAGKHDTKKADAEKKKKKRVKDPDTRARRKVIDMTKYGSTHLKGMFLDLEVPISTKKPTVDEFKVVDEEFDSSSSDSERDENEAATTSADIPPQNNLPPNTKNSGPPSKLSPPSLSSSPLPPKNSSVQPLETFGTEHDIDIQQEKTQSLNLLKSLFGKDDFDDDDDDWVGQESVGSDIDVDELVKGDVMLVDEDGGAAFEVVPKGGEPKKLPLTRAESSDGEEEEEVEEQVKEDNMAVDLPASEPAPPKKKGSQKATLKDLFAPREEEVGFSLLGHLDLDLDLDEELPFLVDQPSQAPQQPQAPHTASLPTPHYHSAEPPTHPSQSQSSQAALVLNPKQALFFPLALAPSEQGHAANTHRARQRDVFDVVKDNGWNWRDPAVAFYRTDTEEDIRKRWEENKGELTRDWKRRWREAGKVSRRKRGGVEDGEF
ncbi:hypothetical protein GALMADRAFT_136042 [Galerina marginata CBS 339.88]|uniref:RRM domain-containing protein n=1 Tax=Galerina marginata (strain CBS 339.88) TaxID=685588 RepID=A0A067TF73_GALM3|nr:hypothetical protein GALMADRAFT_136042 [Galerina marginata CBS 339.88]